jgi:formylglycine-generating enzyme required for sulfatase activity
MVVVPAGKFIMGSPEDEAGRTGGEGPQHKVAIADPFAISKYEVTFDQWDACVAAGACPRVKDAWGRRNMPVINVSWDDAKLYVDWLSRLTGQDYHLPTEAEWEYAARAGSNTRYPWETNLVSATPTATDAAALRHCKPFQLDRFGRTPSVSATWKAMSGSG